MRRRELRKRRRAGKQRRKVEVDREGRRGNGEEADPHQEVNERVGMELVQGEEKGRKRK